MKIPSHYLQNTSIFQIYTENLLLVVSGVRVKYVNKGDLLSQTVNLKLSTYVH